MPFSERHEFKPIIAVDRAAVDVEPFSNRQSREMKTGQTN
jgi:hypothetical protein